LVIDIELIKRKTRLIGMTVLHMRRKSNGSMLSLSVNGIHEDEYTLNIIYFAALAYYYLIFLTDICN